MKKIFAIPEKFLKFPGTKNAKYFLVILLISLIGCTKNFEKNAKDIYIDNGKSLIKINVEIADDEQEQTKGLMFRGNLNENGGMLFVFENEGHQAFWMKNTLIPLDIIFIGKDLEIVDIKNAVPCKEENCALYKSSKPAKYVLEVNDYFAIKNNIKIGDKIILS